MKIYLNRGSSKKILISLLYGLIGIFLLAFVIGFLNLKPLLTKRIHTAVLETTNGLYYLDFKGIRYNYVSGNAEISEVSLHADTTMFLCLKQNKKMPDNVYQGKVNNILLSGISPWEILFSRKLHLNSIIIKSPEIDVLNQKQSYNSFKTAKSPYQIISKFVESFEVERVSLNDITFKYTNLTNPNKPQYSKVENLDLEVSDILIDSISHKDKQRFYYTKECVFKLKRLQVPAKDSLNLFTINNLVFSTKTQSLNIENIDYMPKFLPIVYGNKSNGDDRIHIFCQNLKLEEINLQKLFSEKKLYAKTLQIGQGNISVFTDTRIFNVTPKAKFRDFPHQAFKNLAFKIAIDTVNIKAFKITYSEYNPETKLVGDVKFRHVFGTIINCTNDTIPIAQNPICAMSIKARLFDNADVFLKFKFNMSTSKEEFLCEGKVLKMNAPVVNQVLKSLVMARIDRGFVENFSFIMKGNKYGLHGSAIMIYDDLSVMIFKKSHVEKVFKKRKLLSFIANSFVIKNSNPTRKKDLRIATINYKREPTKAFFYTLWKGIVQGIYGSVI